MRTVRTGILAAALSFGFALTVATVAVAHEGHHHEAKGTVQAVTADGLELKSIEATVQSFVLTAETKCLRGAVVASCNEIAVGERAVVTYEKKDGSDCVIEIKLPEKKP
ncbi:MAG: hypothetical protein ABI639_16705 [Thermoanaerobaculia bacterium]